MGEIEDLELGLNAHVRCGNDDRKLGLGQPDPSQEIDAIGVRQPHVQNGNVRFMLFELLQSLGACGGEHQVVSWVEGPLITQPKRRLVLDDQDAPAAFCFAHAIYPTGRRLTAPSQEDLRWGYSNQLGRSRPSRRGNEGRRERGKEGKREGGNEGMRKRSLVPSSPPSPSRIR